MLIYVDSVGSVFIALWCEMPKLYGYRMEARSELSLCVLSLCHHKLASTGRYLVADFGGRKQNNISMVGKG